MTISYLSFTAQNQLIREQVLQTMANVYDTEWYILGNYLEKFEAAYAQFNQTRYCVGVANGLDALYISLKVLGIGPGDEVLVPANTYIATWLAVSQAGANLVPVEPDPKTYNIDLNRIEAAITPLTKAIMPVHLYGQACNMEAIMAIALRHNLKVIEDNAQAQGATFNGQLTGSFGHISGTSFYPTKNLGAFGDAGAITTNKEDLAVKAQTFRNYGSQQKYLNQIIGINSRLDELQAALLSIKLARLPEWTAERIQLANLYHQNLSEIPDVVLPATTPGATHVYHIYSIRTSQRDRLQQYLAKNGIGTAIHYPVPPHLQLAYQPLGFKKGDFPITEELAATSLSLPLWIGLDEEKIRYICSRIAAFFQI